jgi:S1-C subfamily serine protease
MPRLPPVLAALIWLLLGGTSYGVADDQPAPASRKPAAVTTGQPSKSVEQVAASVRPAVVVIMVSGRDGRRQGLGTGFVIRADGLIATNLHVIDTGRPIVVQLANGQRHEVMTIEASDRVLDLALIRIRAANLPSLVLGDSEQLKAGQTVVAVGTPHGLEGSVVAGVVSSQRQIEGRPMIQLAIPLEPGNSGGPVVDLDGRVQGVLTMKSLVTPNLGFAVAVSALKALLQKPHPIAMSQWLTIGALDPAE